MANPKGSIWTRNISSFFTKDDQAPVYPRQELEALLYQSDLSMAHIQLLLDKVEKVRKKGAQAVQQKLCETTQAWLEPIHQTPFDVPTPGVILMAGINGSGKTTSCARLAHWLIQQNHRVILAAGDTFRAGAIDQLQMWADRLGIECVKQAYKSDPAAVIYQAWQKAKAENAILIADTAGRLHTQAPLMEQLSKIVRVLQKDDPQLPHQSLLVLDGTNGQNALMQSKHFSSTIPITGLVVTKLDGTSKGGAVISSSIEMNVPIVFVGVGEKKDDFVPFEVKPFLEAFFQTDLDSQS
jgi:fused signal recognition particle receptor